MKTSEMKPKQMKSTLLCLITALVALIITSISSAAADDAKNIRDDASTQVAKAWFISFANGDTAVTTALSEVPFNFGGIIEVKKIPVLKMMYDDVLRRKKKLNLKIAAAKVTESTPEKVTVSITVEGDDKTISIFVKPGETFRVIGFTE